MRVRGIARVTRWTASQAAWGSPRKRRGSTECRPRSESLQTQFGDEGQRASLPFAVSRFSAPIPAQQRSAIANNATLALRQPAVFMRTPGRGKSVARYHRHDTRPANAARTRGTRTGRIKTAQCGGKTGRTNTVILGGLRDDRSDHGTVGNGTGPHAIAAPRTHEALALRGRARTEPGIGPLPGGHGKTLTYPAGFHTGV
jgi:hypothetical protein